MAKDDYPVIVYQILAYLYNCLKSGIPVEEQYLIAQGKLFSINTEYWNFIISNLVKDELIDGVTLQSAWGERYPLIQNIGDAGITPKGIQYLTDNSFINKAKEMLKDVKAIVPFI